LFFLIVLSAVLAGTFMYTKNVEVDLDILKFVGRFHPVTLHFPIGAMLALLLIELYILAPNNRGATPGAMIVLALTVASGVVAACTGLLLAEGGGYDEFLLDRHLRLGLGMASAMIVAGFLRLRHYRTGFKGHAFFYWLFLLGSLGLNTLAGHDGGSLTHGVTFLTKYQPEWLFGGGGSHGDDDGHGAPVAVNSTGVMKAFADKCYSCHGAEKQKGGYRMDTLEFALTPGDSEEIPLVPGDAMASYMIRLITLPESHEDVMPPEGKTQLTAEEIRDIIFWVDAGAVYPTVTAAADTNATAAAVATDAAKTAQPATTDAPKPAAADDTTKPATPDGVDDAPADATLEDSAATAPASFPIKTLDASLKILEVQQDAGITVSELQPGKLSVALDPAADPAALNLAAALEPLKASLVKINLSQAQLKPEDWKALAGCPKLQHVHVPYSNIGDADLEALTGLTELSYLNLHGTTVSDNGVKKLVGNKALRNLYIGVSEATVDGADAVRAALPDCIVYPR
jgi:uncharacterized membrane protein